MIIFAIAVTEKYGKRVWKGILKKEYLHYGGGVLKYYLLCLRTSFLIHDGFREISRGKNFIGSGPKASNHKARKQKRVIPKKGK